jgi:hypothetical protein
MHKSFLVYNDYYQQIKYRLSPNKTLKGMESEKTMGRNPLQPTTQELHKALMAT